MTPRKTTAPLRSIARRQGFTLIELLIVVVIIGILAAIAIPKFANTKQKAYVSSMRSDLRNLAGAQEAYWVENRTYWPGPIPDPAFMFSPTLGITITVVNATDAGWSAQAAAPGLTAQTCVIFYGTTPPIPPATADGAVACT
ncbi:MAG TPA: prepilin-type N-terminal cleavage/methylation domain-containing protein [Gemmatimonadales bacterium]|nr:prepilin-type N-terminal cleavage/methylation domain-containing protein [Gemmatimonadales bacterium]